MRKTTVNDKQSGRRDGLCPRCGTDAEWSFLDSEQTKVEVVCPDCEAFELPRAVFSQAEAGRAGPGDTQRWRLEVRLGAPTVLWNRLAQPTPADEPRPRPRPCRTVALRAWISQLPFE